jgi:hypothetical protein
MDAVIKIGLTEPVVEELLDVLLLAVGIRRMSHVVMV